MNITPKDLLDAGVHFGHQTKRWNPRSKPFVFDHRQGISIIDLGKTYEALKKATAFLTDTVANGGNVLFVGTKKQAQDIIREAATSVGMPYCVDRWLGGTLTNYETVKRSIAKFKKYRQMETDGELAKLSSKEEAAIKREMGRMERNFNGILEMEGMPSAMFIVDVQHEKIAVAEAGRRGIPSIGLVDTNSDPAGLTYAVPGNDDAVKSIRIIVETIVEAVQNGLAQRDSRRAARGAADLKAATAAVAAAVGIDTSAKPSEEPAVAELTSASETPAEAASAPAAE